MPSFDVVSEVDQQEIRNAVDQSQRELKTRFDFRGSKSSVDVKDQDIQIIADDDMKLSAVQDILKQKLSKRGISLKSVEFTDPEKAGGDLLKQLIKVRQGLKDEELRKMVKAIKGKKMKVTSAMQGDKLRVTGKKRDDLQNIIEFLKQEVSDIDLQFINFRD